MGAPSAASSRTAMGAGCVALLLGDACFLDGRCVGCRRVSRSWFTALYVYTYKPRYILVYTRAKTHTHTHVRMDLYWRRWSRIQWIDPSGAMHMLPPENPDEIFARKVEYLRAQEAKTKAEEAAIQKAEEKAEDTAAWPAQPANEFAWKEGVDALRGAVEHAHQLSGMLGLMSSRALKVSRISPCVGSGGHAVMLALEAKMHALSRASR
jgi:hypothetical protein